MKAAPPNQPVHHRASHRGLRKSVGLFVDPQLVSDDQMLLGIIEYARRNELPWDFYSTVAGETPMGKWDSPVRLDGLIYRWSKHRWRRTVVRAMQRGVPVVSLGWAGADIPCPFIDPDDIQIGRAVAEYFLSHGFQQFAFAGFRGSKFSELRLRGFQKGLAAVGYEAHLNVNPQSCAPHIDESPLSRAMDRWLGSLPTPIAMLAASDIRARHVIAACRRLGKRVPEDIAICGVDNETLSAADTPMLSSVPVNRVRAGQKAAELLHHMMNGQAVSPGVVLIPPLPLVSRHSSDIFAVQDADLSTALRFIHANASQPIRIGQVVGAVLISRSNLERKFRKQLGRSIQTEIRTAHVERAKRLLAGGSDPLHVVAQSSGFVSDERLCVVFRTLTGMTPTAYRKLHGGNVPYARTP